MLLSHFSGGWVMGASPETIEVMHPTTERPGSTNWLEWQRNIVEQDFRQGVATRSHATRFWRKASSACGNTTKLREYFLMG